MLDILREELGKLGFFSYPKSEIVENIVKAIPINTVPERMKTAFALSHLSHYACHFRRNMQLWDGASVPVNNITFVLADSGTSKDRSHNAVRKCFKEGLDLINEELKEWLIEIAIEEARNAGEDIPDEPAVYSEYLLPIPPIHMAISTGPGLVQHINDIAKLPLLSGSLYSGELGDEFNSNPNIAENIKILSEVYDLGKKEVTYTKNVEFRSDEIDGQPVSALLVGSPPHILHNESISKQFRIAFMSKLARRSWFCYAPEKIREEDFSNEEDPIAALKAAGRKLSKGSDKSIAYVNAKALASAEYNLEYVGEDIPVDDEIFDLFNLYLRYNNELVRSLGKEDTTYSLVRNHLQWKALKLAGALALLECREKVTPQDFILAAQFCEMFDEDIEAFERELDKSPYERLADKLIATAQLENKESVRINLHNLKKEEFTQSVTDIKIRELVKLCAGYDKRGIYSYDKEAGEVVYEVIESPDTVTVSYKPADTHLIVKAIEEGRDPEYIKNLKIRIGTQNNTGYKTAEVSFEDLPDLLEGNFAFSPFVFADGVRLKDNIIGGTRCLVLDVDDTTLSDEDAHFILSGINHHIARSSDPNNPYKYRVLIELDSVVKLSNMAWVYFYIEITKSLGLTVDTLPQSQIFYAYGHEGTLSCTDGTPLETRDFVMLARERELDKENNRPSKQSKAQKAAALEDPLETFWYAFESEQGRRSVSFYRAARHALDLGADIDYVLDLMDNINEYIANPIAEDRLDRLKKQIERL